LHLSGRNRGPLSDAWNGLRRRARRLSGGLRGLGTGRLLLLHLIDELLEEFPAFLGRHLTLAPGILLNSADAAAGQGKQKDER
jgi:hypothetical protein